MIRGMSKEKPMTSMMKTLGIDRMTPDERVKLALGIWESLGEFPSQFDTDAELLEEINRRDAEMDANPQNTLTLPELRKRLEKCQ
jgi:putative addiction module component (TIGR02574 family)